MEAGANGNQQLDFRVELWSEIWFWSFANVEIRRICQSPIEHNEEFVPPYIEHKIFSDIEDALIDPDLCIEFIKYRRIKLITTYATFIMSMIILMQFGEVIPHSGIFFVASIIITLTIYSGWNYQQQKVHRKWRDNVLGKVEERLIEWSSISPSYTYTMLYPIRHKSRRHRNRHISTDLYVRISAGNGICAQYDEPVFASSFEAYQEGEP